MLAKKKLFLVSIQVFVVFVLFTNIAIANDLFLNGNKGELVVKQNRTMISLEQFKENFNTNIDYNRATGEIRLQNFAVLIKGRINSNIIFVNSRPYVLETPIQKVDNQVMLPLYFLHNIYGGELNWDSTNSSVNYKSNNLKSLSYNRKGEELSINLETDLPSDYSINYIKQSKQLIIKLYQVSFARFKQELLNDDFIDLLRVNKRGFNPAVTEVTIGLSEGLDYEIKKEDNIIKLTLSEKQDDIQESNQNNDEGYSQENILEAGKDFNYNNQLIVLDPGHGGSDFGAIGYSGLQEKAVNLKIAKKTEAKLKEKGFNVKSTRYQDYFVSLSDRAQFANQLQADLFISIHTNYHPSQTVQGVETYAHNNALSETWALAWYIQDEILKQTNANDHGLKAANFAVLRQAKMPAILVEAGFLSNPIEEAKLRNSNYQAKIAQGIVDGLISFFNTH